MNFIKNFFPRKSFKKPDFIIAGFSKCGTTALAHNLDKHPDIDIVKMSDKNFEVLFFNIEKNWSKGKNWYFSHFEGRCAGEKTPSYVYTSKSMKRIFRVLPNIKLILCVRNPVDRLLSWYEHKVIRLNKFSPEEYPLSSYKTFPEQRFYDPVKTGCYAEIIKNNVLPYFSQDKCHFVIQENMKMNPDIEMQKILKYLGVDEIPLICENINISKNKVSVDQKTREELLDYYYKYNIDFSDLTGLCIDQWNN